MVRIAFTVVFFLTQVLAVAQVSLKSNTHDFGDLRRADDNWADFILENKSDKTVQVFRLDAPKNVAVLFSSKSIKPDSSAIIRVSYSPKAIGDFKEKFPLHISAWNAPKELVLKGTSTFVANSLIPCPNFDSPSAVKSSEFNISVRDTDNKIPSQGVEVVVYKGGQIVAQASPNEHGEANFNLPQGRYFFSARTADQVVDTAMYVNNVSNHLLISFSPSLIPSKPIEPVIEETEVVTVVEEKPELPVISEPEVAVVEEAVEAPAPLPVSTPVRVIESEILPESLYRQNNLVFLVDVSTSMKKNGKLDLLKVAMIDLLAVLRPNDRFALISYSTETNTIIQTENNLDRDACILAIQALTAGGSTEGAKAIDVAGKTAVQHFVEDGNNQIFLATDGAFNEAIDKARKTTLKYKRRDVKLSVLGIKCGPFTTKQMTELSEVGGGKFIPISDSSEAGHALLDEVKRSAAK